MIRQRPSKQKVPIKDTLAALPSSMASDICCFKHGPKKLHKRL